MAAADVRDMLDLPADGQTRPLKKQKIVEKRPGKTFSSLFLLDSFFLERAVLTVFEEGITRELFALLGEKAPPISLTENKYKLKKSNRRAVPWCVFLRHNNLYLDL